VNARWLAVVSRCLPALAETVEDRLVKKKFTISHHRYFLTEVDWVKLEIVAVLSDEQVFVDCGDIDFYQVMNVPGLT
jgi:hypothetical protein